MELEFDELSHQQWDSKKLIALPSSERVDISVLSRIFENTATSYKYLFFLALLDILERERFENPSIKLDDILLEMLTNAWYPYNYFKLSFGIQDRIETVLDSLNIKAPDNSKILGLSGRETLREIIRSKAYTKNQLLEMVPYRLLSPFFEKELTVKKKTEDLKDHRRNKALVELSHSNFNSRKPFYCFSYDKNYINIHHDWLLYLYENIQIVKAFAQFNWLDYMQKRNPSVPNIKVKLIPPLKRESLTDQTLFWKRVISQKPMNCLFTQQSISLDDLSIDHFLPWSFVAHNQLWNLIPVAKGINSSKSNNLPSFQHYLEGFINMQYEALRSYSKSPGKISWKKVIEPYQVDLHLTESNLLDKNILSMRLKKTLEPLYGLAEAQGFSPDWVYL